EHKDLRIPIRIFSNEIFPRRKRHHPRITRQRRRYHPTTHDLHKTPVYDIRTNPTKRRCAATIPKHIRRRLEKHSPPVIAKRGIQVQRMRRRVRQPSNGRSGFRTWQWSKEKEKTDDEDTKHSEVAPCTKFFRIVHAETKNSSDKLKGRE